MIKTPQTSSRGFSRATMVRELFGGIGSTTLKRWRKAGLMVPPVPIGPHAKGYPTDEIEQLISARVAGAGDDDIKRLVAQLVEARGTHAARSPLDRAAA
jgi:prophage regulatory protein